MKIELIRTALLDTGTPGVISLGGIPCVFSLELPWKNNRRNISCIPEGKYVFRFDGLRSGAPCFRLLDVPGRTGILVHAGNILNDTQGCILPGLTFQKPGFLSGSKLACKRLAEQIDEDKLHEITVRSCCG